MKLRLTSVRSCAVALFLILSSVLVFPGFATAEPAPAWRIAQSTSPTSFVRGTEAKSALAPGYQVSFLNVGAVSAEGVVVVDTLPEGVAPVASNSPKYQFFGAPESCQVLGRTVTCAVTPDIPPGEFFTMFIPVTITVAAPPTVINKVEVQSGGSLADSSDLTSDVSDFPLSPAYSFLPSESGLSGGAFDEAGATPPAGSHPFLAVFGLELPSIPAEATSEAVLPVQGLRNVSLDLPQGVTVNPRATAKCSQSELTGEANEPSVYCPPESQVGEAVLGIPGIGPVGAPIYNVAPPLGVPAEFVFQLYSTRIVIQGGLSNNFHLTATSSDLLTKYKIAQVSIGLWGDPSDRAHDLARVGEGCGGAGHAGGCSVPASAIPLLTMPTSCTEALEVHGVATSWLGSIADDTRPFTTRTYEPFALRGCGELGFDPTISATPIDLNGVNFKADSPSGLNFRIVQPQHEAISGHVSAALRDVAVTLPPELTINASAAKGLGSCTEQQMGYQPEGGKIRFAPGVQSCPDSAKVGTLEVTTPLLDQPLPGAIYLARPYDNPFQSLIAIYLAIEDEKTGIVAKLAGKIVPSPTTGQLLAEFAENPELPLEDINLHFFPGAGAALKTPLTCGSKLTAALLTPWSAPEGAAVTSSSTFSTSISASGAALCPTSESEAPFVPAFDAGSVTPRAGAFSPFVLRVGRSDGDQHLTGIDTTLPRGLLGELAGIPYCSAASIAAARAREAPNMGHAEQANPSCSVASQVGTVTVGAGAGPQPLYVKGTAYLAGPYEGAPLSFVIITPAVAGPFDLGDVVVRVALNVNKSTAQIRAVSDPLPTILEGIPLDLRSVSVLLDRPNFTLNPTSCDEKRVLGAASSQTGASHPLLIRFQVGYCRKLAFKPKIKLALEGPTRRAKNPALKAVVTRADGQANINRASVILPRSEFIDNRHINNPCTRVQFDAGAGNGAECPPSSILGRARAYTPLLEHPLEGPVYFRSNGGERQLPDLVASLEGQVHLNVVGFIDSVHNKGSEISRVRSTFAAVPDAPVSKFVLQLNGGKKGLLQNSSNLCRLTNVAHVTFIAQNGKRVSATPKVATECEVAAQDTR